MFFISRGDNEKLNDLLLEAFKLAMRHPGKSVGVVIGFFSFQFSFANYGFFSLGQLLAVLGGGAIGWFVDIGLQKRRDDPLASIDRLRGARRVQYVRALFTVMGHIAKADGRVSEDEIKVARGIMAELDLSKDEVDMAIKGFTRGKDIDFRLANTLYDFYERFRFNIGLRERFVRVQIQAVLAGDGVSRVVGKLLEATAAQLDIPSQRVNELLKEARIYNSFSAYGRKTEKTHYERNTYDRYQKNDEGFARQERQNYQQNKKKQYTDSAKQERNDLAEAYILLGVSVGDDEKAIKRAYRRLVSQYHPDKMIGRGANSAERDLAHAKTIEIREAYDLIKKTRGF